MAGCIQREGPCGATVGVGVAGQIDRIVENGRERLRVDQLLKGGQRAGGHGFGNHRVVDRKQVRIPERTARAADR